MPGTGPRHFGRHSIACSVADPLWTTTVSGPPDVWPQAVATVSVRTSGTRTNAYSFVIWQSPITGYHGCRRLCRNGPSISSSLQSLRTRSCNSYLNRFEKGQHGWLSPVSRIAGQVPITSRNAHFVIHSRIVGQPEVVQMGIEWIKDEPFLETKADRPTGNSLLCC